MRMSIYDRQSVKWNVKQSIQKADSVDARLDAYSRKHGGFGVDIIEIDEYWSHYWGKAALLYANMGDTYTKTLCYSPITDKFYRSDWGSLVEEKLPRYIRERII
jgi:hypothetical protein